jgi:hypothetical protein
VSLDTSKGKFVRVGTISEPFWIFIACEGFTLKRLSIYKNDSWLFIVTIGCYFGKPENYELENRFGSSLFSRVDLPLLVVFRVAYSNALLIPTTSDIGATLPYMLSPVGDISGLIPSAAAEVPIIFAKFGLTVLFP